jgi:hypothetical protein
MEVGNSLSIVAAAGLIAATCAGAFLLVLTKIIAKESRRIKHGPETTIGPASQNQEEADQHGFKEGAALHPTRV